MDTADASIQAFADNYQNPYADDAKLRVRFELMDVENPQKSKIAGYPVYDQLEMVRIRNGMFDENVFRATDHYKQRFPRQYAMFKAGEAEPAHGTSLKVWPPMAHARAELELYAFHGVRTLEELVNMPDGQMAILGNGAFKRRDMARQWLEQTKGHAPVVKLEEENAQLKAQISAQSEALAAQGQAIEELRRMMTAPKVELAPAPKRVRKPKAEVTE